MVRRAFVASGQVQGVGFRPFVYRLAAEDGLTGTVGNTSEGVRMEVQGTPEQVAASPDSPTGRYLAQVLRIEVPQQRRSFLKDEHGAPRVLRIRNARGNNRFLGGLNEC